LRVIGAARIEDPYDLLAFGKKIGDRGGGSSVTLDPQRQRLQPLQKHPGIERT
jgi:hypothetical protein